MRSGPELVTAARAYMGAPWVHQGRQAQGMDCAGLLWLALIDLGESPPDVAGYGRRPWKDGLRSAVEAFYGSPVEGLQVGDVVLQLQRKGMRHAGHIAIVGDYKNGGLSLVHARADIGKVAEHRLSDDERGLIVSVYR